MPTFLKNPKILLKAFSAPKIKIEAFLIKFIKTKLIIEFNLMTKIYFSIKKLTIIEGIYIFFWCTEIFEQLNLKLNLVVSKHKLNSNHLSVNNSKQIVFFAKSKKFLASIFGCKNIKLSNYYTSNIQINSNENL